MSKQLEWVRRTGKSSIYYTADTVDGRIRISRVNKHGVAVFKVRYPDGTGLNVGSVDEGKAVAQAHVDRLA